MQLGYPVEADVMRERLTVLKTRPDHLVIVAVLDGAIGGWLHAQAT